MIYRWNYNACKKKIVHNLRYFIRVCTPLFKILATGLPNTEDFMRQRLKRLSLFSTLFVFIYRLWAEDIRTLKKEADRQKAWSPGSKHGH